MKFKLFKICLFISVLFICLSCNQNVKNPDVYDNDYVKVKFTTDLPSRMAIPSKADITAAYSDLYYYLEGIYEGKETQTLFAEKTFAEVDEIELEIEKGSWIFTLTAKTQDSVDVLQAVTVQTINNEEDATVFFQMSVIQDTTEKGSVKYNVKNHDESAEIVVDKLDVKISKIQEKDWADFEIFNINDLNSDELLSSPYYSFNSDSEDGYLFIIDNMPVGLYYLVVDAYVLNTSGTYTKTNIIQDTVKVMPLVTSVNTIEVESLNQNLSLSYFELLEDEEETSEITEKLEKFPIEYNKFAKIKIPSPSYEPEYYSFEGWYYYDSKDELVKIEPVEGLYPINSGETTGISRIVAKYVLNHYEIEFDLNGGSLPEEIPTTLDVTYKTIITMPLPTRNYYSFVGWKDPTLSDSDDLYYDGMVICLTSSRTLTAVWEANGKVPDVEFSVGNNGAAEVDYNGTIELSNAFEDATIYYSFEPIVLNDDGIEITDKIVVYDPENPINITSDCVIYAFAVHGDFFDSEISSLEVTIKNGSSNGININFAPVTEVGPILLTYEMTFTEFDENKEPIDFYMTFTASSEDEEIEYTTFEWYFGEEKCEATGNSLVVEYSTLKELYASGQEEVLVYCYAETEDGTLKADVSYRIILESFGI